MELDFLIIIIVYLVIILILHLLLKSTKKIKSALKPLPIIVNENDENSEISLKDSYVNTETNNSISSINDLSINNSDLIISKNEIDKIDSNIENELSKYLCKNRDNSSKIADYFPELIKDFNYNDIELKSNSNSLLNNNTNELYPVNSSKLSSLNTNKLPINEKNNIYAFDEFNETFAPI